MSKISVATKSFFESFLKGQRSLPCASVPERPRKGSETAQRCYRRRSWERKRFRSFATFSVFVRSKAKGKRIPMRPGPTSIRLLHSVTVVHETCTGNSAWALSRMHLTPASLVLHLRIHQNVRASCTCTRTPRIFSPFMADGSRSRGLLRPVFWKTKGVTSLPEIAVCRSPTSNTYGYCLTKKRNIDRNIITYRIEK